MKYKIQVPEPCHENWNDMSPSERGRFCNACQKEVVDFTGFTNKELAQKFSQEDNLCGRFLSNQLDTIVTSETSHNNKQLGFLFGITSILSILSTPLNAKTKLKPLFQSHTNHQSIEKKNPSESTANEELVTIKGQVLDESTKEGISFCNVMIKGKPIGTTTDFYGNYEIKIPLYLFSEGTVVMEFSFIGFESQDIKINPDSKVIDILLNGDNALYEKAPVKTLTITLGNAISSRILTEKISLWQRFKNVFRKKN